jgi:pimeloyl-ACP methyl ester carboxylesterase
MKLVLACTYAYQDRTSGNSPEQAKLAQVPPDKMANAMIHLAFNNPLYRITFGIFAGIQSKFIGASAKQGISGQAEACVTHNTLERLPLITAPTLVIVGTEDKIINPVSSDILASKIPNAKLVKLEGGSHSFTLEMSNIFNHEVINFLKNGFSETN